MHRGKTKEAKKCFPMKIFDMASLNIIAGPKGLKAGEELTVRDPLFISGVSTFNF